MPRAAPLVLVPALLLVLGGPLAAQEDGAPDWSRPSAVPQPTSNLPPPRILIPGQGTARPVATTPARATPVARVPSTTRVPAAPPAPSPAPAAAARSMPPWPTPAPATERPPWEAAPPEAWPPRGGWSDEQPIDLWDVKHLLRLVPRTSTVLSIKKHHNQPWLGTWKALDLEMTLLVVGQRGRDIGASVTFHDLETGAPLKSVLQPYVDGEGNVSIYTSTVPVPDDFEIFRSTLRIPYRAFPPPRFQRGYDVEARVRLLRLEADGRVTALARGATSFLVRVDPHCPKPLTCEEVRLRSMPNWKQQWVWDWNHLWTDDPGPIEDRMDNPHIRADQEDDWYEYLEKKRR